MKTFQRKTALTAIIAASLIWSSSGIVIKSSALSPLQLSTFRSVFAALFLVWYLLRVERVSILTKRSLPFFWCALGTALNSHVVVLSMRSSTAAHAVLLLYTAPIWVVAITAMLFRRMPSLRDAISIAGVVGGLGIFFSDQLTQPSAIGLGLGLLSGFLYAVVILALRSLTIPDRFRSLILGYSLAVLPGLFLGLAIAEVQPLQLLAPLYLGAIVLGFAYVLFGKAVGVVSATEASLLPFIEPVLSPLWVALLYSEPLTARAAIGGATVIGFLIFKAWPTKEKAG